MINRVTLKIFSWIMKMNKINVLEINPSNLCVIDYMMFPFFQNWCLIVCFTCVNILAGKYLEL